jgi:hypothetical protein
LEFRFRREHHTRRSYIPVHVFLINVASKQAAWDSELIMIMLANEEINVNELAECNMDWSATAAIYVEETAVTPLCLPKTQQAVGFCGSVRLTLNSTSTIAFCRKATQDYQYRYFALEKPAVLNIELDYIHNNNDDNNCKNCEGDHGDVLPQNLRLKWEHYPEELPDNDKTSLLLWLTKKCNQKLEEENELMTMCASFSIVELCEHETWSYWETIHQDEGYRLILLPPKSDHLYHSNVGTLIDPRDEALKLSKKKQKEANESKICPSNYVQEYARRALLQCWKKLYITTCPICFDTINCDRGVTLPCGDFFCEDCFPMYLQVKVTELAGYRTNPFLCPAVKCREEISITDIVQEHLSTRDHEKVQRWLKDLKYPPCYSLDRCLSPACTAKTEALDQEEKDQYCMRQRSTERINPFIFCDACDKTWCELCLKRIRTGVTRQEHKEVCESQVALKFCRRYLRATDDLKKLCQTKYPWIIIYAHARQQDVEAIQWILENGQCCPNCSTGVVRSEGCFHMKCPTCATHFCYECGKSFLVDMR